MLPKFLNFVPIDIKIGTHIDLTYTMYNTKQISNQNNVTRISMATKYPILNRGHITH